VSAELVGHHHGRCQPYVASPALHRGEACITTASCPNQGTSPQGTGRKVRPSPAAPGPANAGPAHDPPRSQSPAHPTQWGACRRGLPHACRGGTL